MKRIIQPAAIAAATLLLLGACAADAGQNTPGSQEIDSEGTFRLALPSDPGAVFPYQNTSGAGRQVFAFGYDTLVSQTPEGETVPRLAESWTVSDVEVVYTLRDGVTCQDGSELKPTDVAAAFSYIKAPETLSPWRALTVPMDYSVSADDDAGTFTITTEEPFGLLLRGAGSLPIVCPAALEDPEGAGHVFMGTGPYEVTEYVTGDHYTLEKRGGYAWGPSGATTEEMPKTVVISFIQNESTAASQLLTGEVNAVQLTGPDQDRVEAADGVEKASSPAIVGALTFNHAEGRILNDVSVRQALVASINREEAAAIATDGKGKVATSLLAEVPIMCPANVTEGALADYDVKAANQILDDAGWKTGSDGIRIKEGKALALQGTYKSDTPQPAATMEYLATEWRKIGVDLTLNGVTNSGYSEILYGTLDFDMAYTGINVEMPFMLTPFYSGPTPLEGGRNSGDMQNADFGALSAEALRAPGDGCDLWVEAHRAMLRDSDQLPLAEADRPYFVKGGSLYVVGLHTEPTSYRLYK